MGLDFPYAEDELFDRQMLKRVLLELREQGERVPSGAQLAAWLDAMLAQEQRAPEQVNSRQIVRDQFRTCLSEAGITSGRVAELGGHLNSDAEYFPEFDFEWLSLFPVEGRSDVRACDICHADHIESERYDAIFSVSVMEHVAEPWLAARQMQRMLKPGGIVFHSAPFSYFYHGAPADYWRYTPDGFVALFPSLLPLHRRFYGGARRRDNRGKAHNAVDRDGGPEFAPDSFGGWRENWTTLYCGQKSPEYAEQKRAEAQDQLIIDLMRQCVRRGLRPFEAAQIVVPGLRLMELDEALVLQRKSGPRGLALQKSKTVSLFRDRVANGLEVSHNSAPVFARFIYLLGGSDAGLNDTMEPSALLDGLRTLIE